MKKLFLLIAVVMSGCLGHNQSEQEIKPQTFEVAYTSRSGDKIMKESGDTWGSIVWVEDVNGNIKAIARH